MSNTRKISQFIITLVVICLVLFVTESILKNQLKSIKSDTIGKINAIIDHEIDDEIMIWGASTAYVNIDPEILSDSLHCSVMNMGLDGTNIDQYNGLLMEYLSYAKNCKTLILAFDINDGLVQRNQFHQTSLWVHQLDNPRIQKTVNEIDPELLQSCIPFSNLTLYDKHIFKYFKSNPFASDETIYFPKKGFLPLLTEKMTFNNQDKKKVEIGERIIKKINALCKMAISKNIKPIIVITPCFEKGQGSILNKSEVISTFNKFASRSITVLDLHNTATAQDPNNFNDNVHLNRIGSAKFSKELVQKLKLLIK
jgi:hypothetical protein